MYGVPEILTCGYKHDAMPAYQFDVNLTIKIDSLNRLGGHTANQKTVRNRMWSSLFLSRNIYWTDNAVATMIAHEVFFEAMYKPFAGHFPAGDNDSYLDYAEDNLYKNENTLKYMSPSLIDFFYRKIPLDR